MTKQIEALLRISAIQRNIDQIRADYDDNDKTAVVLLEELEKRKAKLLAGNQIFIDKTL